MADNSQEPQGTEVGQQPDGATGEQAFRQLKEQPMQAHETFVIPISLVGRPENVSDKTVWRIAQRLESAGEIELERTPTGRGLLNIPGYKRLRQEILSARRQAA